MSTLKANVEIGFDKKRGLLTFTQILPGKEFSNEEFPAWPWTDMVHALGFFNDVQVLVDQEVKHFWQDCQTATRTIMLGFNRHQPLPPSVEYLRCANSWLKINKDLESGVLVIELRRIPGTYKDFVLLDALDHFEGRAGHGKNRHVDGRPGVMRQKLECALQYGPIGRDDSAFRPTPIPVEERVQTDEY